LYVARNVDRCTGTHWRFPPAELRHAAAAVDEENLVRDEMRMRLDLGARREVFVSHDEVGRPTVLAIDFENERTLPGVTPDASLSLSFL
jgi:hypothetical protein